MKTCPPSLSCGVLLWVEFVEKLRLMIESDPSPKLLTPPHFPEGRAKTRQKPISQMDAREGEGEEKKKKGKRKKKQKVRFFGLIPKCLNV
ncbi:hypothetical protein CEXT_33601 [Caerostris extrusa]|uniref:Uncharacterized protein n=1 Tax=Caerostris extrusa TaxID=172846 RepID=A0AAV4PSK9_CAEEX|nr:hypothetical protein CEXT_33601 [Caerostris extrusa]